MRQTRHVIDYVEIAALDLARAKTFYTHALGWAVADYGPRYAGIQSPDGEMGGLTASDEARVSGALVILCSDDNGVNLQVVEQAGGTIPTPPFTVLGEWEFHFRDSSGNEPAVWSQS